MNRDKRTPHARTRSLFATLLQPNVAPDRSGLVTTLRCTPSPYLDTALVAERLRHKPLSRTSALRLRVNRAP